MCEYTHSPDVSLQHTRVLNGGQQVKLVISIHALGGMKALKALKQKAAISCWRSDEIIDSVRF